MDIEAVRRRLLSRREELRSRASRANADLRHESDPLSTDSAEQVAHAVYLHAWQHSARYDPSGGSALAWIMTMGHRAAVDRLENAPAI